VQPVGHIKNKKATICAAGLDSVFREAAAAARLSFIAEFWSLDTFSPRHKGVKVARRDKNGCCCALRFGT